MGSNNYLHTPWYACVERFGKIFLRLLEQLFSALQLILDNLTFEAASLEIKVIQWSSNWGCFKTNHQRDWHPVCMPLHYRDNPINWSTIFYQCTAIVLPFLILSSNLVFSVISKHFDLEERNYCHSIRNLILFLDLTNFSINSLI